MPQGAQEVQQAEADIKNRNELVQVRDPNGSGNMVYVRKSEAPGMTTQVSPTQQASDIEINKDFMTNSYRPALDAGDAASRTLAQLDAQQNINLADTGWGAETRGKAASILASIGVPGADKIATDQQKFQSIATTKLMQNLAVQKGPQTEGDAQRAAKTFTALANTPDANRFIEDMARAQANQERRKASFYRDALPIARAQGGNLAEIERRWSKLQGSIWDDPVLQQYKTLPAKPAAPAAPKPASGVPR
jgi:hypothetical protein